MFENIIVAMSSMSPLTMTAAVSAAECKINGEIVPCSDLPSWFLPLMTAFPIVAFLLIALIIVSGWVIYQKAGKPGWASLIPIYNVVNILEIIGKPTWWVLLMFVPFVNFIVALIILFKLAKVFGKGVGFGIGMLFLPFIFVPILAFGKSVYTKPAGAVVGGADLNYSQNTQSTVVNTPVAPSPSIEALPTSNSDVNSVNKNN